MPVYHVTVGQKTYTVEIPNPNERPVRAIVDGEPIEVAIAAAEAEIGTVEAPVAAPVAPQPAPIPAAAAESAPGTVTAPLPGTVVSIAVAVGDTVERGQELCVLEAMKMNNPIRAAGPGTVEQIFIRVGEQVPHGAPLMVLKA